LQTSFIKVNKFTKKVSLTGNLYSPLNAKGTL